MVVQVVVTTNYVLTEKTNKGLSFPPRRSADQQEREWRTDVVRIEREEKGRAARPEPQCLEFRQDAILFSFGSSY